MKAPASCANCTNPFCRSLSERSRQRLFESKIWINYSSKDDQPFFLENRQILILERGAIIGYRSSIDVKMQSITLIRPGDLLGIVSLFSDVQRESFSISPLTDSAGCMIPLRTMEQLIVEEPDICQATMRQYSSRYSRVVDSFINKTLGSSEQRVEYALKACSDIGIQYVTHENLALLSGLNRVTVTKTLGRLYRK